MKTTNIIHILAAALLVWAPACSHKETDPAAQALMDEAQGRFQARDYAGTLALLDSLQRAYPAQTALQRQGMALRPQAIEQLTEVQMATADSLMAQKQAQAERLKGSLKWVKTPRMLEGYWVAAEGYDPALLNHTGLQGRVSEVGQFYVVSSVNPSGGLKHTSVSLDGAQTPAVAYDGESNSRIGGGEMIVFSPEQSDTIGVKAAALSEAGAAKATLTFHGAKTRSLTLNAKQIRALATAYGYAEAVQTARETQVEKQRLERTLELARKQRANTTAEAQAEQQPSAR